MGLGGAAPFTRVSGCDLCRAARITPWHHEDDICWIAECDVCDVPMVVWRYHGTEPPAEHVTHMHTLLREVATRVLGGECYIDDNMRNIPDHYHAHGRPKGGFFGPGAGASASAPTSGGFHGGERAASQGQRDPAPAAG